jgi:hypothetical protein
MPRTYKEKLGTLRGVGQWKKLESAADIKRLMAWCIHSIRDQTIDPRTAAIMAQIGAFMLKAVEVTNFEGELADLRKRLDSYNESRTHNSTVQH